MADVSVADRDLSSLFSVFRKRIEGTLSCVIHDTKGKHGVATWRLVETYRSQARQNWLYAQGRTRPGAVVTWTRNSLHRLRIAADFVPVDARGVDMWDAHPDIWQQLGHCARANDLQWGGDGLPHRGGRIDLPHVQFTAGDTVAFSARMALEELKRRIGMSTS